jgi:hypothetical protein
MDDISIYESNWFNSAEWYIDCEWLIWKIWKGSFVICFKVVKYLSIRVSV